MMIHPCNCQAYNGTQCYNCLNGAHSICIGGKCEKQTVRQPGLLLVFKGSEGQHQ